MNASGHSMEGDLTTIVLPNAAIQRRAATSSVLGSQLYGDTRTPASATCDGARRTTAGRSISTRPADAWWTRFALAFEILGRSEFAALREPTSVSGPHATAGGIADLPYLGFPPRRRDYADATLGVRVHLVEPIVLSLGVFKSINAAGVRAEDWSLLASVEGTF